MMKEVETDIPVANTINEEKDTRVRNFKKNISKYFKEYCENTSIHGLKYLIMKISIGERLYWLLLIVLTFCCCLFLINKIYNKYVESPFIVSFATRESPIYTIPFPAVTICPITKSARTKLNFTDIINKLWHNETVSSQEYVDGQYMSLVCDYDDINKHYTLNKTFTESFFTRLHENMIPIDDIIVECSFMGYETQCKDIFTPIILDEGICYTFNILGREDIFSQQVKHYSNYHSNITRSSWKIEEGYQKTSAVDVHPQRALVSGADSALEVYLLQFKDDLDYLCAEDVQGFDVLLHTPHTIPRLKKQFFTVPLDTSVLALIKPKMITTSKQVKKYSPASRECYFQNERFLKYFRIYTPENCQLECLTNFTLDACECVNFFMPRDNSTVICGNGMLECMRSAEYFLKEVEVTSLIEDNNPDYGCNCMPLCTELTFDMEQSQTELKWKEKFEAQRWNKMSELIDKPMYVSKLRVFFKNDKFLTSQRNELYGPTDFLANFGGLLGLFTGFSLVSLAEIIYFITLKIWCHNR